MQPNEYARIDASLTVGVRTQKGQIFIRPLQVWFVSRFKLYFKRGNEAVGAVFGIPAAQAEVVRPLLGTAWQEAS
jgi:hypothetical protein